MSAALKPNDLESFLMPFTPNRAFKKKPRMLVDAKGMHYRSDDGREILDMAAGLWCVNAGHKHPKIVEAVQKQAAALDYACNFSYGHPLAFQAASRLCADMPGDIAHVAFSNSGSEAVDTGIKLALTYQRARGKGTKVKIIGRERAYHGVNMGGTSIGGITYNRRVAGLNLMPGVDHLPDTHNKEKQAFSRGQPEWGGHLADALESRILLHGPENVAAVFIEPVAGSIGVLPPPKGYLQKLRQICDKHDVLLVFDEVITAYGRLGRISASDYFGVMPDMILAAKAINNGAVPMGATFMRKYIYDALMRCGEHASEFMHGYTYSGHPLACAAALATQDVYRDEGLFEKARKMESVFADTLHGLKGAPHVVDIRAIGLMGAIEFDPGARDGDHEMSRPAEVLDRLYWEENTVVRFANNGLSFCPPLIVEEGQVHQLVERLRRVLGKIK